MSPSPFRTSIASTACASFQPIASSTPDLHANLALDGTRHQTWEGVGGAFNELGFIALERASQDDRREVLKNLFHPESGCRFNLCRIPIGASDYAERWYSPNEVDGDLEMKHFSIERDRRYLIPYIKAAQAVRPDLRFFASPWSPPTWMKEPAAYNYGTLRWEKPVLEAYALYFRRFVEAFAAEGIPISQVHVQNEPHSDQKFPSCLWTGERFREFIGDYLGPHFQRHGIATEIWLGTLERDDYDEMANTVLSDERARRFISGVGYQWAGKHAVRLTRESWPELRLLQTENECGDGNNTWEYAEYVFRLIRLYVSSGVAGYVYWNMVLEEGGRSTWGWRQNSMVVVDRATGRVTYTPEFYVMKHLGHFVEPDSVVLGLKGPLASNSLCFERPNGDLVLLTHNPFDTPRELCFEAHGACHATTLPPRSISTLIA